MKKIFVARNGIVFKMYRILKLIIIGDGKFEIYRRYMR